MSNPNDLVMISRGDVEALKQEAIFGVFRRDAVEFDKLNALLSNALVVSGEFGISFMKYTEFGVVPDDYKNQAGGYRAGWNDCIASLKYTITTPQQPQSVADALEEVANFDANKVRADVLEVIGKKALTHDVIDSTINAIRALIKRNAVKEGE